MSNRIDELTEKLKLKPDQVFYRCRELEKCVQAKPEWLIATLSLGRTYLQLGKIEKAKQNLELSLELARKQNHDDPAAEAEQLLKECNSSN
jgi:Tfp pilus assembly protein PilF